MNKKLYRDEYHKVLGGVCSGLAEYFEMDVTIVRLLFAFTFFIMGVGFIPYIILWIVLPKKGYVYNNFNPTVDYTVPPQQPGSRFNTPPPPPPGSQFGNNPYSANPFANNPPENMPPKQRTNGGIIVGVVLILIGAAILIDNYDLIPDFDFERLWPVVLVVIGGALIVSGQQTQAWQNKDWQATDNKENPAADSSAATDESAKADSTSTTE